MISVIDPGTLKLKDLVDSVSAKLLDRLFKGAELFAKKGDCIHACKILDILEDKKHTIRYKVGWFERDKEITGTSVVDSKDLVRKKLPFSRGTLKSFIRESTSRSCPWVVYDNVAKKHGVSSEPPDELRDKINSDKGQRLLKIGQKRKADQWVKKGRLSLIKSYIYIKIYKDMLRYEDYKNPFLTYFRRRGTE